MRSPEDYSRFKLTLVQVDQAFWESEQKWGSVGSRDWSAPPALAAWQRGWSVHREALEAGDPDALEAVGPKW